MPVAQSANGVSIATITTGTLLVTKRTMTTAMIRPIMPISLMILSNVSGRAATCRGGNR